MSGLDGLGWPDDSNTPETDVIVSRFRKGETSSDGLILTMEKLERERDELLKQVARLFWELDELRSMSNQKP